MHEVHDLLLLRQGVPDEDSVCQSFCICMNCKQGFTGALQLQLARRWWRRYRGESVESRHVVASCHSFGDLLGIHDEEAAGNRLIDAVSQSSVFRRSGEHKLKVVSRMAKERPLEALKLLDEVASQAKQEGDIILMTFAMSHYARAAHHEERYEETVAMATEFLEHAKSIFGESSDSAWIERKHDLLDVLAHCCGMTGSFDESKRAFDELIASATRIYGREHENTRDFFRNRAKHLLAMVKKAEDLALHDDLANGTRYMDAVVIESKAHDFSDAKDPHLQINWEIMVVAVAMS